eukprot:8949325-Heterocapsa_arctica.AAC.1
MRVRGVAMQMWWGAREIQRTGQQNHQWRVWQQPLQPHFEAPHPTSLWKGQMLREMQERGAGQQQEQ